MKRGRIHIIETTCRRCGKPVATASRSLVGNDAAKARLDRICEDCITPEEHQEIERVTLAGYMGRLRG